MTSLYMGRHPDDMSGGALLNKLRDAMRRDLNAEPSSVFPRFYNDIWKGICWRLDDSLRGLQEIRLELLQSNV